MFGIRYVPNAAHLSQALGCLAPSSPAVKDKHPRSQLERHRATPLHQAREEGPLYGAIQRRGRIFPRLRRGPMVDLGPGPPTGVTLLGPPDSECTLRAQEARGVSAKDGRSPPSLVPQAPAAGSGCSGRRLEEARMHRAAGPPGAQKVLSQDSTRALARFTGLRRLS